VEVNENNYGNKAEKKKNITWTCWLNGKKEIRSEKINKPTKKTND